MTQVTVIIPSFNRANALIKTMQGLAGQTTSPEQFEVILVDDGSSDKSIATILGLSLPFRPKVIQQQNSGPGAARNSGARVASSELLVFLDADMIPHTELINEYILAHEKHPRAALVGRQLPWPESFRTEFAKVYNYVKVSDLGANERLLSFYHLSSGVFAVGKSVFESIGWFDESLRMTEDTELGYRFQVAGTELIYLPNAIGFHNHPKTFTELCSNTQASARWTGILMQMHQPTRGSIPVYVALEPISGQDPWSLKARKLYYRLLATPISRILLKLTVRVFAAISLSPGIQRRIYKFILDGYRSTGLRIGLMNKQFAARNQP